MQPLDLPGTANGKPRPARTEQGSGREAGLAATEDRRGTVREFARTLAEAIAPGADRQPAAQGRGDGSAEHAAETPAAPAAPMPQPAQVAAEPAIAMPRSGQAPLAAPAPETAPSPDVPRIAVPTVTPAASPPEDDAAGPAAAQVTGEGEGPATGLGVPTEMRQVRTEPNTAAPTRADAALPAADRADRAGPPPERMAGQGVVLPRPESAARPAGPVAADPEGPVATAPPESVLPAAGDASEPEPARVGAGPVAESPVVPVRTASAVPQPQIVAAAMPAQPGPESGLELARQGLDPWRLVEAPAAVQARSEAPPAAVQAQSAAGQIVVAIGRAEQRSVELRLDPPELGRVQIHLTTTEDGLRAMIVAERQETHELLRRHAEALGRDLAEAGFGQVNLEFSAGNAQSDEGGGERGDAPALTLAGPAAAEPVRAGPVAAAGRLDIRL